MLAAVMMAVAVKASSGPLNLPDVPLTKSPMQLRGDEEPLFKEASNPWKYTSNMDELSGTDLLSRVKNMYNPKNNQGADVDLEAQKRYQDELNSLAQEVSEESDKIAQNQAQQDANNRGIRDEAGDLVTVHHNQNGEQSLYNLAASNANQIWASEHKWQSALLQATKVENFVAGADTDVISVLGEGAEALDAAKIELDNLQKESMAKVDDLDANCAQKLLDWSNQATGQVNDQTRSLVMVFERLERLQKTFDKAHDLVVTLLQELSAQMKTVTGLSTVGENEASLIQMHEKVKAALAMPVKKVMHTNHSIDESGFWHKMQVLKDAFELHTGQAIEPMEFLMQKFRDA